MDDGAGATDTGSRGRPPYWITGLILLGLVILILVVAFLLNQNLRPHVGIQPVSTPAGTATRPSPTTGATSTAAVPTPRATPTPTLTPHQQVEQAYHRYWHDYSRALYTLSTSQMNQVAANGELKRVKAEVASLRAENRAVHVRVSHDALIVSIKGDSATLYDEQRDSSFLINPVTKEPHQGSNQVVVEKDTYHLKKFHGTWKVVKSVRQR